MSRGKAAKKREILEDPLFESVLLTKFINIVMQCGKKSVAEKIVYKALEELYRRTMVKGKASSEVVVGSTLSKKSSKKETIKNSEEARKIALDLFYKALENIRPKVEVRSRRIGGATYQVPKEVQDHRGWALAMRWLVKYAKLRSDKTMILRLVEEILEAGEGRGGAVKKREDVHKMAHANQAFAHFRW